MDTSFLDDLASKYGEPRVVKAKFSVGLVTPGQPDSLMEILGLDEVVMTETSRLTLEALESGDKYEFSDWIDFKWKLTAFINIQEIFDAPIIDGSILNAFHMWYFYFESKHLLNELIICGLNGLYAASDALLRPFLEFNILQNYYYRLVSQHKSLKELEKYFKIQAHPKWSRLLKGALPNCAFAKPIRLRLETEFRGLSERCSHPYHPYHSPRQHAPKLAMPSLEGIFFWEKVRFVLDAVLWTYYVNFPMLFHPKNMLTKFGFNRPVGLFIDEFGGYTVEKSLREEDYQAFLNYSRSDEVVMSLTDWYESFTALTDEEIIRTWDKSQYGELKNVVAGYAIQMAGLRATREGMALVPVAEADEEQDEFDYDVFSSYSFWEKRLKHRTKKH